MTVIAHTHWHVPRSWHDPQINDDVQKNKKKKKKNQKMRGKNKNPCFFFSWPSSTHNVTSIYTPEYKALSALIGISIHKPCTDNCSGLRIEPRTIEKHVEKGMWPM